MTGTSIDALDLALLTILGTAHENIMCVFEKGLTVPLGDIGRSLRRLAEQEPMTAREIAGLAFDFSHFHADAVNKLLGTKTCDLICVHGQTVFHEPPLSWQLFQPAPLAYRLDVPVVCDLRQADLAAGGQGAPITPLADCLLFKSAAPATVINLGGYCNITYMPSASRICRDNAYLDLIGGGDVCSCNQLLDAIARDRLGVAFDAGGAVAASGIPIKSIVDSLLAILKRQSCAGRSLGTGDELLAWTRSCTEISTPDLLCSVCTAIATIIAEHELTSGCERILVAGGGVHNAALMDALRRLRPEQVNKTDYYGIPAQYREAACFAVLGLICRSRFSITLPQITKYKGSAPLSGQWTYPPSMAHNDLPLYRY